jgi:hypothetical protein
MLIEAQISESLVEAFRLYSLNRSTALTTGCGRNNPFIVKICWDPTKTCTCHILYQHELNLCSILLSCLHVVSNTYNYMLNCRIFLYTHSWQQYIKHSFSKLIVTISPTKKDLLNLKKNIKIICGRAMCFSTSWKK